MLTCWQASISCPVAASVKEPARPPVRLRDSRRVARKPRGASADAAASPANPAPTIRTRPDIPSSRTPARPLLLRGGHPRQLPAGAELNEGGVRVALQDAL